MDAVSSRHSKEVSVATALVNLCAALELSPEQQWETGTGPVDIYLHGHRTLIECKPTGKIVKAQLAAGGKQFEQIRRYVVGVRQLEAGYLPVPEARNLEWTGILTDGRHCYLWKWQDALGALEPLSKEPQIIDVAADRTTFLELLRTLGSDGAKPLAPARPHVLYSEDVQQLQAIWEQARELRGATIQFNLWWDSIRASGMEYGDVAAAQQMFVCHCALVSFARAIRIALLDPEGQKAEERERLQTEGFINWIRHVAEGRTWSERVQAKTDQFDWRKRPGDILQSLYQEIVPKSQRKVYGEYYTPDWLAEMLVDELLDEQWCQQAVEASLHFGRDSDLAKFRPWGVLDPTCGSGTFLYHATRRLIRVSGLRKLSLTPQEQADVVARLVFGIDIHPVAVEFAQTTVLRCLPAAPSRGDSALNIWQGDSLLAEWGQGMQELDFMRVRPGQESFTFRSPKSGRMFTLPRAFVVRPEFTRDLKRFTDQANSQLDFPKDMFVDLLTDDFELMQRSFDELKEICALDGNGIWAYHVNNWISPTLLAERKVNRILANPPWITLNIVRNLNRKKTFKDLAQRLDLWVGGRRASSFDVASTFVMQCSKMYLADSNRQAAWILNAASTTAGSWKKFREQLQSNYEKILSIDLQTQKPPFTTSASAVWYIGGRTGRKSLKMKSKKARVEATDPWDVVKSKVILSDEPDLAFDSRASEYVSSTTGKSLFRQGACFRPHVFVRVDQSSLSINLEGFAQGKTVPSRQQPWKLYPPQRFVVPKSWVHAVVRSYDLLPFATRASCSTMIVPLVLNTKEMVSTEEAVKIDYWRDVSAKWEDSPSNKASGSPNSLIENLNFYNKLTAQIQLNNRHSRVVYNEGGKILRAARIPNTLLVDETCFYFDGENEDEALYLVGILNAETLKNQISATRETDRHFHAHLWRKVPIPRFDCDDSRHKKLVELVKTVEFEAQELASQHEHWTQVRLSRWIREMLSEKLLLEINSVTVAIMSHT